MILFRHITGYCFTSPPNTSGFPDFIRIRHCSYDKAENHAPARKKPARAKTACSSHFTLWHTLFDGQNS